jgi:hypothetical protein
VEGLGCVEGMVHGCRKVPIYRGISRVDEGFHCLFSVDGSG